MNHDADRPDPSEQPIRARVPDHVTSGAFSTGVIVMTAQTEFILDFVQNLGRPHQIVARVVMPHNVLPQLVDALQRNMELYRNRWGELPTIATAAEPVRTTKKVQPSDLGTQSIVSAGESTHPESTPTPKPQPGSAGPGAPFAMGGDSESVGQPKSPAKDSSPPSGSGARQASAQEIYDDLKIRDELLSGAYANAVMIGHGPHEFSFDFITNFYPHSAVSARVFLAAGQVPRLYDSLKGTWDQMRQRMQPPSGNIPRPPEEDQDSGYPTDEHGDDYSNGDDRDRNPFT